MSSSFKVQQVNPNHTVQEGAFPFGFPGNNEIKSVEDLLSFIQGHQTLLQEPFFWGEFKRDVLPKFIFDNVNFHCIQEVSAYFEKYTYGVFLPLTPKLPYLIDQKGKDVYETTMRDVNGIFIKIRGGDFYIQIESTENDQLPIRFLPSSLFLKENEEYKTDGEMLCFYWKETFYRLILQPFEIVLHDITIPASHILKAIFEKSVSYDSSALPSEFRKLNNTIVTEKACVFELTASAWISLDDEAFGHIKYMAGLEKLMPFPQAVRFMHGCCLVNRQVMGWEPEQMGILVDRENLWIYSKTPIFPIFKHYSFERCISRESLQVTLKKHSIKVEFRV